MNYALYYKKIIINIFISLYSFRRKASIFYLSEFLKRNRRVFYPNLNETITIFIYIIIEIFLKYNKNLDLIFISFS